MNKIDAKRRADSITPGFGNNECCCSGSNIQVCANGHIYFGSKQGRVGALFASEQEITTFYHGTFNSIVAEHDYVAVILGTVQNTRTAYVYYLGELIYSGKYLYGYFGEHHAIIFSEAGKIKLYCRKDEIAESENAHYSYVLGEYAVVVGYTLNGTVYYKDKTVSGSFIIAPNDRRLSWNSIFCATKGNNEIIVLDKGSVIYEGLGSYAVNGNYFWYYNNSITNHQNGVLFYADPDNIVYEGPCGTVGVNGSIAWLGTDNLGNRLVIFNEGKFLAEESDIPMRRIFVIGNYVLINSLIYGYRLKAINIKDGSTCVMSSHYFPGDTYIACGDIFGINDGSIVCFYNKNSDRIHVVRSYRDNLRCCVGYLR